MANRRMISKSISTSKKLTTLRTLAIKRKEKDISFSSLLFTWLQPHVDDWGRCDGTAFWIKYNVVPTYNYSEEQINIAINDMVSVGLIVRYNMDGKTIIQVINFEDHQTGLGKRTESKFSEPTEEILRNSQNFSEIPPKPNLTKPNLTKEKEKHQYGEHKNVLLTDDEYKNLKKKHGEEIASKSIEILSKYIITYKGGDKYKSHYRAILKWAVDEAKKKKSTADEMMENLAKRRERDDRERVQ